MAPRSGSGEEGLDRVEGGQGGGGLETDPAMGPVGPKDLNLDSGHGLQAPGGTPATICTFVWWAHVHTLVDSTPGRESAGFTASRGLPWCLRPAGRVLLGSGSN